MVWSQVRAAAHHRYCLRAVLSLPFVYRRTSYFLHCFDMEAQQTTYTYAPLDEARKQIRLLHLAPKPDRAADCEDPAKVTDENRIHCSFSVVSLDDEQEFEALSYAWGDPKQVVPVWLEGHEIKVTVSLHCALDNLRMTEADGDRVIWADALCINQGDQQERQSQVAQMHYIYSKASQVVAFLGEAWEGCDIVMGYLAMIASDQELHFDPSQEPFASFRGFDAGCDLLCTYVAKLFTLPWFCRTWTVQESLLAQDLVFQCGQHTIPEKICCDAMDSLAYHSGYCCNEKVALWSQNNLEITPLRGLLKHRILRESSRGPSINPKFVKLLIFLRTRESYDPRDRVYGVLSLADRKMRESLAPNYALSVSQLYNNVVVTSVAIGRNLDVFSCVTQDTINEFRLPSFVPNWAQEMMWGDAMWLLLRWSSITSGRYNACRDSQPQITFAEKGTAVGQIMIVDKITRILRDEDNQSTTSSSCAHDIPRNGFRRTLDRCDNTCTYNGTGDEAEVIEGQEASNPDGEQSYASPNCGGMGTDHGGSNETISTCSNASIEPNDTIIDDYYDVADIHSHCTVYQSRPAAFWRTMCGNFIGVFGFAKDISRIAETSDFSRFMKWQMSNRTLDKAVAKTYDDDGFDYAHCLISNDRLFFTTGKGYMGWAPIPARAGDVIALMPGGKVPYVLRSLGDDDSGEGEDENSGIPGTNIHAASVDQIRLRRYRFVGDAYVHGIMDGEAYDGSKLESITLV
jgi:hypothetical protein